MLSNYKISDQNLEERIAHTNTAVDTRIRNSTTRIPKKSHTLLFDVIRIIKEDFKNLFIEAIEIPEVFLDIRQKRKNGTLDQDLKKEVSKEFRSLAEKYSKFRDYIKYADNRYKEKHGGTFSAAISFVVSDFSLFTEEEAERAIIKKTSILRTGSNQERERKTVAWDLPVGPGNSPTEKKRGESPESNSSEDLRNSQGLKKQENKGTPGNKAKKPLSSNPVVANEDLHRGNNM
jgi:hypothetical protein